jgi:hypothetical protein
MRLTLISAAVGAVVLAAAAGVIVFSIPGNFIRFSPIAFVCRADDEIDIASRSDLEGAAESFVGTLLGDNPGAAFDAVAARARENLNSEAIRRLAGFLRNQPATGATSSTRVFLISGLGNPNGSLIPCGHLSDGGDLVMLSDAGPEQGHVILTQPTNGHLASPRMLRFGDNSPFRVRRRERPHRAGTRRLGEHGFCHL